MIDAALSAAALAALEASRQQIQPIEIPEGSGALSQSKTRKTRSETRAVVYHTTSRGLPQRLVKAGHTDPMAPSFIDAAVARYQHIGAKYYANALVAPDGAHAWLAHPDLWVVHAKTPRGHGEPPRWWRERWPDVRRPLSLINLGSGYINPLTVSIDVIPLPDAGPLRYTDESLDTAARIGRALADRYGLTLERRHHLAHSDLDPWSRGNARGGWDPGWDWNDFMQRLHANAEVA